MHYDILQYFSMRFASASEVHRIHGSVALHCSSGLLNDAGAVLANTAYDVGVLQKHLQSMCQCTTEPQSTLLLFLHDSQATACQQRKQHIPFTVPFAWAEVSGGCIQACRASQSGNGWRWA